MVRKMVAELLGTGLLVYFGVGVATLSFGFGTAGLSYAAGVVATALAFGFVLLALAYVLGPISGCHINPAVTIGVWLSGRIPLAEAVMILGRSVRRRHTRGLAAVGYVQRLTPLQQVKDGPGHEWLGRREPYPHQRGRCLPDRGDHDRPVRLRRARRHQQDRECRHRGHRHRFFPHGGPSHRNPGHGHVGEPGSQPRSRPHRRRDRPEPGVAVHRRAAGRRRRGRGPAPDAVPGAASRAAGLR